MEDALLGSTKTLRSKREFLEQWRGLLKWPTKTYAEGQWVLKQDKQPIRRVITCEPMDWYCTFICFSFMYIFVSVRSSSCVGRLVCWYLHVASVIRNGRVHITQSVLSCDKRKKERMWPEDSRGALLLNYYHLFSYDFLYLKWFFFGETSR